MVMLIIALLLLYWGIKDGEDKNHGADCFWIGGILLFIWFMNWNQGCSSKEPSEQDAEYRYYEDNEPEPSFPGNTKPSPVPSFPSVVN